MPRGLRVAAAQENPDTVLQKIVRNLAADRLMGVGDAAGRPGGHELAPVNMAADRPAALQRLGENRMAARVAHRDRNIVHLLTQRPRLRPAVEDAADFRGGEIAAGGFEPGVRCRHGARHGEVDRKRRATRILQHPLDAGDIAHVADLVAVAEDGRGAVEQRRLGKRARGHHAALDVHVGIDETGGNDAAARVVELRLRAGEFRLPESPRRFHRRDAAALDPEFAVAVDALGVGREGARSGDDEVGRRTAHRHGGERTRHGMQRGDGESGEHARSEAGRAPGAKRIFRRASGAFVELGQREQQFLQFLKIFPLAQN